ncbi:hypothetical protein Tco_0020295 [Tanacetum coccineum]
MDTTRAQQKALDDEIEPTLQVAIDALKLTPFYNAFEITADVPEIYMQEFWVTVSKHHSSLRFKLNAKSHTVNVDNFKDMLNIFPKLPGHEFEEPPLKEEILSFIRDLGHTGEIKFLSYVNVNHMHQPWRSFVAIINKCLSGKTTALENLVYQVEKNSKKNNDMYYPQFTKVMIDYFMAKDQAIPRRNKMFWHYARDDFMFTTVRVISKHQDTQVYGAILPQHLTNQAMLESEAYMTYRAYATGEKTPKPIYKEESLLSEVALSEADQMKLATKRSKKEFHSSYASGSGASDKPKVPDVPEYRSESEEESWTFNQGEDDEENDEHDNDDGDDFVYPNLSTYKADDQEEEKEDEKANDDDEVSSDQMVSTPPDYEILDVEEIQEDDDNMKDAVNVAVQLKSNKLREDAQAENDEFLKQIDSNIKAIIKDQNIIDKIEENKSMNRSDIQKNLYNTLIESYNSYKDLFASYGDVVTLKRGRDDQNKDEEPSAGSNRGMKQMRSGKEESSKEET